MSNEPTLSPGARAVLELELADAQRDLAQLLAEQLNLSLQADVERALGAEGGRYAVRHNVASANLRLRAFTVGMDAQPLKLRIANLQSQLKSCPADPASTVTERHAAMDDTHNFQVVAA